ncbi:ANTAR domain-containing protein [Rhodococcus pseudokoreensis]|uniref:ANTAR domain-containing protein n=1 Tax=Rhodococcus pseudokoreensis TaxID=2811421 RepID=UPI001F124B60|nr:ANTAR domain-containing protein [Rhodococcus pseudokoreensis]
MPTDTSAVAGRNPSKKARAQLLSTAVALLAEQYGCGQEAAFDALLDIAHRNHATVANAAEHVLSRRSTDDGREERTSRFEANAPCDDGPGGPMIRA